jgi:hypothetical protein
MDHKLQCSAFKPPPPQTMAAYFDQVTQGLAGPAVFMSLFRLDKLLQVIEARPTAAERAALLSELDDRFQRLGRREGWLDEPPPPTPAGAGLVADFVVQDLLGIKGQSANDKAVDALKGELKSVIETALNDKGRQGFKVLELLLELAECKTPEEVVRVLAACGLGRFGTWLAQPETRKALIHAMGRSVGLNKAARYKIIRLVAARMTWLEVTFSRLARINLIFTALEIFLTPTSTADDATMRRLTFLTAYGRMQAARHTQFGKLVSECTPDGAWTTRQPLLPALKQAVLRMH